MILRFVVSVLIIASSVPAMAQSCANYFANNLRHYLEVTNRENNNYLSESSVDEKINSSRWMRRYRINRAINRIQREGFVSERDIYVTTDHLMVLFFGQKDVVDRYILKKTTARQQETIRYQVRTQLIEKGLRSFVKDNSAQFKINLWIRIKKVVRRMNQSQVLNFAQLAIGLPPTLKPYRLPDNLMMKVIWEGADANLPELQKYLKSQSKMDVYAVVRRLYTAVFLGMYTLYSYNQTMEMQAAESHAKAQIAVVQLNSVAEDLPNQVREFKRTTLENALKDAVAEYESEVGRPLTAEEYEQMRKVIYE